MVLQYVMVFLGLAAFAYLILFLFSVFGTSGLLFPVPKPSYQDGPGILKLRTPPGTSISAIYLENPAATHTALFFHGNAEDLGLCRENYTQLSKHAGFNVLAFDYPGYGTSGSRPSEKSLNEASETAFQWLLSEKGCQPSDIVLYGRSLGGGPACELATRHPVAGLVLEQTFKSVFRVLTNVGILPWDWFVNLNKIHRIQCPVLILHGKADSTIPFSHAKALYAKAKQPKLSLWVDYAQHGNSLLKVAGKEYWAKLAEFKRLLSP
jgi:fermentation-respiration switch protein FrsA (DUF1100 family)